MKRKLPESSDDDNHPYKKEYNRFAPSGLQIDERLCTQLHYAAKEGDVQMCEQLITKYPVAVLDTTDRGLTPLDLAAKEGHLAAFKVIKDSMSSTDINAQRPNGQTTIELLVKQDKISLSQIEIFKLLIDEVPSKIVSDIKLLPTAALKGHRSLCELVLEKYPDATFDVDECGHNALHIATSERWFDIINILKRKLPDTINNYIHTQTSEGNIENLMDPEVGTSIYCIGQDSCS